MPGIPILDPPDHLAGFPEWVLIAFLMAASGILLVLFTKWAWEQLKKFTLGAVASKPFVGWYEDKGPESLPPDVRMFLEGDARINAGEVWDHQLGLKNSPFDIPQSITIRWAVLSACLLRIVGPWSVGMPVMGETLFLGAAVVALMYPYAHCVDVVGDLPNGVRGRVQIGLAGLLMVLWGGSQFLMGSSAAQLFNGGLLWLGACVLAVAFRGVTSGHVRRVAVVGWVMVMVGEVLIYDGILSTPLGAPVVGLCVATNVMVIAVTVRRWRDALA